MTFQLMGGLEMTLRGKVFAAPDGTIPTHSPAETSASIVVYCPSSAAVFRFVSNPASAAISSSCIPGENRRDRDIADAVWQIGKALNGTYIGVSPACWRSAKLTKS
jgi:hypothetical protein